MRHPGGRTSGSRARRRSALDGAPTAAPPGRRRGQPAPSPPASEPAAVPRAPRGPGASERAPASPASKPGAALSHTGVGWGGWERSVRAGTRRLMWRLGKALSPPVARVPPPGRPVPSRGLCWLRPFLPGLRLLIVQTRLAVSLCRGLACVHTVSPHATCHVRDRFRDRHGHKRF